jgi:hypothetical protein
MNDIRAGKSLLTSSIGVAVAVALCGAAAGGSRAATRPHGASSAALSRAEVADRVLTVDNHKLKLIDLRAGEERPVAASLAFESAALSPDGTEIAANRIAVSGLELIDANTGAVKRLTRGDDRNPTWSPDGKSIAFARGSGEAPLKGQGLYIVRRNGSRLRLVKSGVVSTPAWSPDGKRIAFNTWSVRGWDGTNRQWLHTTSSLATVSPAGRYFRRLTTHLWPLARPSIDDVGPIWSPNSSSIAFQRTIGAGDSSGASVYLINANGSGLRRITPASYFAAPTGWSPDSHQLADWRSKLCSACATNGPMEAWITDLRSGTRSEVGDVASVVWSPSGKLVAFGCNAAPSGVCVVDSDGSVVGTIVDAQP